MLKRNTKTSCQKKIYHAIRCRFYHFFHIFGKGRENMYMVCLSLKFLLCFIVKIFMPLAPKKNIFCIYHKSKIHQSKITRRKNYQLIASGMSCFYWHQAWYFLNDYKYVFAFWTGGQHQLYWYSFRKKFSYTGKSNIRTRLSLFQNGKPACPWGPPGQRDVLCVTPL